MFQDPKASKLRGGAAALVRADARPPSRFFAAGAVLGGMILGPASAGAAWEEPLTAKQGLFPNGANFHCGSNGGWAETHDDDILPVQQPGPPSTVNTMPVFCPRSLNDFTANHSHGSLHATGFLSMMGPSFSNGEFVNAFFGVYDETAQVYGSSDIAVRLNPKHAKANPDHHQGYVDAWVFRNSRGIININPHDTRHATPPNNETACHNLGADNSPTFANDWAPGIENEYKTAQHAKDTCVPSALRRAKEPAVATTGTGLTAATFVAWLERDLPKANPDLVAPEEVAWKVYVGRLTHGPLHLNMLADPRAQTSITPLPVSTANMGSLNRFTNRDARSPKITVVAGVPWVAWAEDNGTSNRDTLVKAYNFTTNIWETKGAFGGTGETKNCYWGTVGPPNTHGGLVPGDFLISGIGYSTDIATVTTTNGPRAVVVTSNEELGECRLVVRMYNPSNNTWQLVTGSGGASPGSASGLIGNGHPAITPRIFGTPSGDVFVAWSENGTLRVSTANVNSANAPWKDVDGPDGVGTGWRTGVFPSIAVTPFEQGGNQWHILNVAAISGSNVSVARALVGMLENQGFAQTPIFQTFGEKANVESDGTGTAMLDANAWAAPTNLVVATNGQFGALDNYLIWPQRADNHRALDTGIFVRRGF
jgi:hypothetical protein